MCSLLPMDNTSSRRGRTKGVRLSDDEAAAIAAMAAYYGRDFSQETRIALKAHLRHSAVWMLANAPEAVAEAEGLTPEEMAQERERLEASLRALYERAFTRAAAPAIPPGEASLN